MRGPLLAHFISFEKWSNFPITPYIQEDIYIFLNNISFVCDVVSSAATPRLCDTWGSHFRFRFIAV